jgi:CheY-like chemotaxis protein
MTSVLIVDDDRVVGELVQEVLQDEGYLAHAVGSATGALAWMAEHWPDLVLVDLRMPEMDGRTFIRMCRQHPRGTVLQVVLMSAAFSGRRLDEDGVAILPKPFDLADLLSTIRNLVIPREASPVGS